MSHIEFQHFIWHNAVYIHFLWLEGLYHVSVLVLFNSLCVCVGLLHWPRTISPFDPSPPSQHTHVIRQENIPQSCCKSRSLRGLVTIALSYLMAERMRGSGSMFILIHWLGWLLITSCYSSCIFVDIYASGGLFAVAINLVSCKTIFPNNISVDRLDIYRYRSMLIRSHKPYFFNNIFVDREDNIHTYQCLM